jgi:diguanylate cyclase (GGDEF)-like protein
MKPNSLDEVARSRDHLALMRYIAGSREGIDSALLTPAERAIGRDLIDIGYVREVGDRFIPERLDEVRDVLQRALEVSANGSDRELGQLLNYLQELTGSIIKSQSIPDLFDAAFRSLIGAMEFDVGVFVMVEQTLDVYLSRRESCRHVLTSQFEADVRKILQSQIPVSFESTDIVVRSDFDDLKSSGACEQPLTYQTATLLRQENRPAGVVIVYRGSKDFEREEQRLLDFFSNQVSMILSTIRAQEQIQNLADTDDMTGIWNKRYFRRQLPFEIERSRIYQIPLSLLMFDVDNFKDINDTFGHSLGDVVLSELCGTVRESLRQPDLFARFGGDEFAVILPHTDYAGAQCVADRVIDRVRSLAIPGDGNSTIRCSLSMGIATYLPPEMTATDLIRIADERLYIAKKSGKNRYA